MVGDTSDAQIPDQDRSTNQTENASENGSSVEGDFDTAGSTNGSVEDRRDPETRNPQCPRPSPPQQPVVKRQRSGSAPPQPNRPKRNPRMPVQLQYTHDFKQHLTTERTEVPENPEPLTPVKKRHSREKREGWCAKRTKSTKPTNLFNFLAAH